MQWKPLIATAHITASSMSHLHSHIPPLLTTSKCHPHPRHQIFPQFSPFQSHHCRTITENIKPRDFYFLTEHRESPLKHQLVRFHPVHLGERHSTGRYKIIHKLGNGVVPTIWLARGSRKGQRYIVSKPINTFLSSVIPF